MTASLTSTVAWAINPSKLPIEEIARMPAATVDNVLSGGEILMTEKYHPYLNAILLLEDALSSRLKPGWVAETGAQVCLRAANDRDGSMVGDYRLNTAG